MPKVVLHDSNGVKEFVIIGEVTIGRLPENTVAIFDPQISRKHARISIQNGECIIEDMGSAGGTRVNNQPITRYVLQDTDQIEVGSAHLVFLGDKPQQTGDGLFEKTMVGNDPLFAPTMLGGAPPSASAGTPPVPPPPPAQPAPAIAVPTGQPVPPQTGDPTGRPTVPIRPQIILPRKAASGKRRIVQLVVAVVVLGVGGLLALQTFDEPPKAVVDWTFIDGLYKDERIADIQARLEQLGQESLSDSDRKTLQTWKNRLEGRAEVRAVEALIFEKNDFVEASQRALADGNRYADSSKRFGELARVSIAAKAVLDAVNDTAEAEQARQLDAIERMALCCREAEERFKGSQTDLERISSVVAARQICVNRMTLLETRLRQHRDAEQLWTEVKTHREAKNWNLEVVALKQMALLPVDVTSPLTAPAQVESLLRNANAYLEGLMDFQKGEYDAAIKSLSSIEPGDPHEPLAREALSEMRATADYSVGAKLYREGKGEQALAALANAKTDKAIQLRVRIQSTVAGIRRITDLQNRKALSELIAEATRLLPELNVPEDEFYRNLIEKARTSAQRQRIEALYAELEQLVQRNRQGDAYLKSGALLKDPDLVAHPEIQRKTAEVHEKSLKSIQQDVGTWVQGAEQLWNQYKQEPITSDERTAAGSISAAFRKKAGLLNQAFEKIAQVQTVVKALPEEKAKPVMELYEQIRQEVLRQAEKVFAVRTQYSQLGNFDRTRQADEMIVLLGDVPGNQYYRLVVKKE